jgi:hypothetical protein
LQLVLDVDVDLRRGTPSASAMRGVHLIANAFADALRLCEQVIEEIADIVRDAIDHREDLFEHIPDEIRGGHPKIFGESADVLRQLLRDPGVKDSLLATRVRPESALSTAAPMSPLLSFGLAGVMATLGCRARVRCTSRGRIRVEFVSRHGSHCDPS